jgi:hypothetical protein
MYFFENYEKENIQEEKIQEENIQEENIQEENIQEEKTNFCDLKSTSENASNKLVNRQYIYSNNYKKSIISNKKFIVDNIFSNDIDIENKIYNLIYNPYQKKLNLINLILDSELDFKFDNYLDIIKFFNWLYPLTIEYKMASGCWNVKSVKYANKEKILLQNSISKVDMTDNFSLDYIDKIKKTLYNSGIKYYYFEFKTKRFNKIKDIIWVFDKN